MSLQSNILISSINSLVIIISPDKIWMNFSLLIKDSNKDKTKKGMP